MRDSRCNFTLVRCFSFDHDLLETVGEERINPLQGFTLDSDVVEFSKESLMRYGVKGLAKVHYA